MILHNIRTATIVKMSGVAENLKIVCNKIAVASAKRPLVCAFETAVIRMHCYIIINNQKTFFLQEYKTVEPRLVAVGKLHSHELIIEAYVAGQRHFGENYVNELAEKGHHPDVLAKCNHIRWHFIGHLQRNKVNKLLSIPNLYVVETVDNEKISSALDSSWLKCRKQDDSRLKVMVQVNTSKEEGIIFCISIFSS